MKFKMISLLSLALISTSVFAATGNDNQGNNSNNDGQIIATLMVLNKNEIAASKEALKMPLSKDVKAFAQLMKKDHGMNLQQTMSLSKKIKVAPVDNDTVKSLKEDGQKELASLKETKKADFEKTYVDDMVADHKNALKTIDDDLLKNVTNADLKNHLEATEKHIQMHLDKIQAIQNNLKTSA